MTLKLTQLSLLCPVCGAEVPPSGRRGPRRTYCSEACKQAAIDAVFAGRPEDLPRQGPSGRCRRRRLEGCGVEVEGPGHTHGPFISASPGADQSCCRWKVSIPLVAETGWTMT